MSFVLETDLPPDALALAERVREREAPVVCWSGSGSVAYVACDPLARSTSLDPEPELALRAMEHGEIPRWFGLIPYEARRSLERSFESDPRPAPFLSAPCWRRYSSVAEISNKVIIIGDDSNAADELWLKLRAPAPKRQRVTARLRNPIESSRAHEQRVRRALERIARGEIYEVNLARAFELSVTGSAFELLAALTRDGLPPHAGAFEWPELRVAAASPELLLRLLPNGRVSTSPIKGTRPRSRNAALDNAAMAELDADPKERAELAMVIDVERNDLGRVARPGSVVLEAPPRVVTLPNVFHRVATVSAELEPSVRREQLFESTLPSGSVTGAPKIRAMEVIAELEATRRGLYTGGFGIVRRDGGVELSMAIRTLTARGSEAQYLTGGGIVADSVPEREVEETLWKARNVLELLGINAENWAELSLRP
jgi:anthranilate/para-aminobenzoate synthase component I